MSVTIKDVAAQANVAPSTVSRVISDSPLISDKTKRKVQKVMDEMGYHLNYNAQMLATQSTKTIGIIMKNSTPESMHNSFFPEVIRGISALCSKHDFSISLTTGESEEEIFTDTVKMVRGKRVDGMIVLYSKKDDKVVPYLIESGIPFVVIGKPLIESGKIMFVDNDNVQAAKEATEFLLNLGHEKIAFIGEDEQFEVSEARLNGFIQAVNGKNLDIREEFIKNIQFGLNHGKQIVTELLDLAEPPTALVVSDDLNALIVLTALSEKNIKVPDDMSMIVFNNSVISEVANPPLTTVDTQIYQLGYESANCLIELVKDPQMFRKSVIIPTVIVERNSCLPL
ncbi:LacI family DNA-binding transcriptional regulator [Sporosarcina sp. E16_8]|uniref:LacI family DNA-binding transcriptional regulator n=1 Tax=Sporosarcina sp. E16_8 TaxID=2789295 RepID=UPI001A92B578|nr:LacI family DNA-binding transcriptional regulator [Sporosarcina sp. E16_8]MBO0587340.1 LacI family DNA-binding transcriptional regulator [Sporosarcina sp. E16_8]